MKTWKFERLEENIFNIIVYQYKTIFNFSRQIVNVSNAVTKNIFNKAH